MSRIAAALLSFIAVIAFSNAASAVEAANGQTLAQRWCAACHVVASDQKTANAQAPPFSTIGKTPDLDPAALALFLLTPHPKMPDMNISRAEAADIRPI